MPRQFDVVIERDSEGYYVASVPQIPACHTQARSLDEVAGAHSTSSVIRTERAVRYASINEMATSRPSGSLPGCR